MFDLYEHTILIIDLLVELNSIEMSLKTNVGMGFSKGVPRFMEKAALLKSELSIYIFIPFPGVPEMSANQLYVVHSFSHVCNLLAQFDYWHVLFRVSYYKGKPDHAAAIYHLFVNYMLMW